MENAEQLTEISILFAVQAVGIVPYRFI